MFGFGLAFIFGVLLLVMFYAIFSIPLFVQSLTTITQSKEVKNDQAENRTGKHDACEEEKVQHVILTRLAKPMND